MAKMTENLFPGIENPGIYFCILGAEGIEAKAAGTDVTRFCDLLGTKSSDLGPRWHHDKMWRHVEVKSIPLIFFWNSTWI